MAEIHLSEQDQKFVDGLVSAGIYKRADAVVAAGLRLLCSKVGWTTQASGS